MATLTCFAILPSLVIYLLILSTIVKFYSYPKASISRKYLHQIYIHIKENINIKLRSNYFDFKANIPSILNLLCKYFQCKDNENNNRVKLAQCKFIFMHSLFFKSWFDNVPKNEKRCMYSNTFMTGNTSLKLEWF